MKRPDGSLETEVLNALWALGDASTPAEVIDHLDTDLAYTSIATVLGRLCDKGLAQRKKVGRSYVYEAASSEADLTARRISSILDAATDRDSALAGFAKALDADEAAQLAALLQEER